MPTIKQFAHAFSDFATGFTFWKMNKKKENEIKELIKPFSDEFKKQYGFDIFNKEVPENLKNTEITGKALIKLEPLVKHMTKISPVNYLAMCDMCGETDIMKGWKRI